jgi:hypothetical protein
VRNGADAQLSSARATYKEMLLQVARDYPGLPDLRTLALSEIVFFYDGLRPELRKHTKPTLPSQLSSPKRPQRPTKPRKHGR